MPETDPLTLACLRYAIGGVALALFLPLVKTGARTIRREDWFALMMLALIFYALWPWAIARALEDTTASRSALVYATMPVMTLAIGAIARIEKPTWRMAAGIALAVSGAFLALGEGAGVAIGNALTGDAVMAFGTLCAAGYTVFASRFAARYGAYVLTTWAMIVGAAMLVPVALIFGDPLGGSLVFSAKGWWIVAFLSIPGGALMAFMWMRGIEISSPNHVAITVGFNPLTAIFVGAWLLEEPLTWRVIVGFVLIMLALLVVTWRPLLRALNRQSN